MKTAETLARAAASLASLILKTRTNRERIVKP